MHAWLGPVAPPLATAHEQPGTAGFCVSPGAAMHARLRSWLSPYLQRQQGGCMLFLLFVVAIPHPPLLAFRLPVRRPRAAARGPARLGVPTRHDMAEYCQCRCYHGVGQAGALPLTAQVRSGASWGATHMAQHTPHAACMCIMNHDALALPTPLTLPLAVQACSGRIMTASHRQRPLAAQPRAHAPARLAVRL